MLKAFILICSLVNTPEPRDCDIGTADLFLGVPGEYGHPASCFTAAQSFLGESEHGVEITSKQYLKVQCVRSNNPPPNVG
jgi:hypothetical protein